MSRALTKEQWLERAKSAHGDKYDYSLVTTDFKYHDTIEIICPIHGPVPVKAGPHIRKINPRGCRICTKEAADKKPRKKKTTEQYTKEVEELTNNEFTVLGEYKDNKTDILMLHRTCGTKFPKQPRKFLDGERCKVCNKKVPWTIERLLEFALYNRPDFIIENLDELDNDTLNIETVLKIKHKVCGFVTDKQLNSFIDPRKKIGCKRCTNNEKLTLARFKQIVKQLEGDKYIVLETEELKTVDVPILMKHNIPECGYEYHVTPKDFKKENGNRCPICNHGSFKRDKPAILYYIRVSVDDKISYKIGITGQKLHERYAKYLFEQGTFTVIKTWEFERGIDAFIKEQEILKEFNEFRLTEHLYEDEEVILLHNGDTELFIKDVLNLDK